MVSFVNSLDASNIFEFSLKWEKNKGLDPEQCPSHAQYLSEISEKMTGTIEQQITEAAHILQLQSSSRTYQEVLAHGAHCKEIVTKAMVYKMYIYNNKQCFCNMVLYIYICVCVYIAS